MLSTLGKIFSRQHFEIFFLIFSQKTGFDISCKLSTICMKCQILFSGKNKNIISLPSAENAQRVVKVKAPVTTAIDNILKYLVLFSKTRSVDILCELFAWQMIHKK